MLLIGSSKGIGYEIHNQAIDQGYNVYSISRTDTSTKNHLCLDILRESIPTEFLPEKLDALIYCPGSINLKPFKSLKEADFLSDFQINVLSAVKIIQQALTPLKASGNATILLFSTVAVSQGMAFHSSISAAKGAIEGLTRSLAAEFAPNIRVNAIAPSLTDTTLASKLLDTPEKRESAAGRHALKRVGEAQKIAAAALNIIGPNFDWMTGQIIHIDGGMSIVR